jgi:hypothetical protein
MSTSASFNLSGGGVIVGLGMALKIAFDTVDGVAVPIFRTA